MQKTSLVITVLGILILVTLFWLFKPVPDENASTVVSSTGSANIDGTLPAQANDSSKPQPVTIEIKHGQRVSGPDSIQVKQGQALRLIFLSDAPGELHLHGYDLSLRLVPQVPAELAFTAVHSGRFEYELHGQSYGGHHALGAIEVLPE